ANMVTDAHFLGERMGAREGDRYLSARPFFHVAGSTLAVVLSAVHAITLVTMHRFTGEEALRLIREEACTLTSGNDTMYLMMLGSPD
ncbi:AMP-binding protein, partial [Klebsiella variicola]|uniref:AMP-binding protein n=2 Tax=Pseudomonadota TaxID=1224 RepID=UPI0039C08074